MFFGRVVLLAGVLVVLCGYGMGTEQYIPIGQSPGVSGVQSVQGTIVLRENETHGICVGTVGEHYCALVPAELPIYLDRSARQEPNELGTWSDLAVGQYVEWFPGKWLKIQYE